QMVKDVITKRSKGHAFIQYTCQDDAMLALENMDQKNFYGRTISVELAKPGWENFGIPPRPPRASGPPKKWNLPEEQGEEVDCWY
ncbi:RNA-binding protein 3, partial [Trifolium medium]|nr:RNA-binding protein 3 [Trifolium medium]